MESKGIIGIKDENPDAPMKIHRGYLLNHLGEPR